MKPNEVQVKVAASIITAVILAMGTISWAYISNKVDNTTFENHRIDNEKDIRRINREIDELKQQTKQTNDILIEIRNDVKWLKENG